MTFTDTFGGWDTTTATDDLAHGTPPPKRVTPPLLMGDILMSHRGVPVFVEEWLRLEKERDARRAEQARLEQLRR